MQDLSHDFKFFKSAKRTEFYNVYLSFVNLKFKCLCQMLHN